MQKVQIDFTQLSDKELDEFKEEMEKEVEKERKRREQVHHSCPY